MWSQSAELLLLKASEKKQGRKGRPTKDKIKLVGRHGIEVTAYVNGKGSKCTLCWWKCYLDSCVLNHIFFSEEFLTDIEESNAKMTSRHNSRTKVTKMKGTYYYFQVWLNKKGIANLISIPMME